MKTVILCLIASFFFLQACNKEVLPDTKKITYRVSGDEFDVTFLRADGTPETIYAQKGSWKQDVFATIGEPLYLMARGSDNIVIRIVVSHEGDTVRKAKDVGGDLVFIDMLLD